MTTAAETYAVLMAAMRTSPARRRQRSVRVTLAVLFLTVATLAVLAALPTQSPLLLSIGSVAAIVLGWAALRITWTEVLQSRVESATERASTARAYKSLFAERAVEHAEFTSAMTDRLSERNRTVGELEGTIVLAEKRALEAETRLQRDSRRLVESQRRVEELEQALAIREAEVAEAAGAIWDGAEVDTIVDLLAWDEKSNQLATDVEDERKHA